MNDSAQLGWQQKLLILSLLWIAGLYLRLPVLVAPPLAPLIDADLGLSQTALGALTTVPVLMLSLGAIPGAIIIARLGPLKALGLSILVVCFSSMARGLAPPVSALFAATTVLGLAIAVMQPALPALVLRWCPGFAALGSAVYMNGMLMGEFIGGGLTIPFLLPIFESDWRSILVVWSLPALLVAMLVLFSPKLGVKQFYTDEDGEAPVWMPPLGSQQVWLLGVVLGAASAGFFGTNAYLPVLLEYKGIAEQLSRYLFIFNGTQVLGSLAMLGLAGYLVARRVPILVMAWAVLAGLLGVVLFDGWLGLIFAVVLGLATCIQLILTVALVPQISSTREAAPLAAGMFMVGYLLGFVIPLLGGLAADWLQQPLLTFLPLILLAAVAVFISHLSKDLTAAFSR